MHQLCTVVHNRKWQKNRWFSFLPPNGTKAFIVRLPLEQRWAFQSTIDYKCKFKKQLIRNPLIFTATSCFKVLKIYDIRRFKIYLNRLFYFSI